MQEIAVPVFEENEAIALGGVRLRQKLYPFCFDNAMSGIEVIDGNRNMTDSRSFEFRPLSTAFSGNDFQHIAVGRFHEVVPRVFKVNAKTKLFHVPFGQLLRVGRSNCRVLQAIKHRGSFSVSAIMLSHLLTWKRSNGFRNSGLSKLELARELENPRVSSARNSSECGRSEHPVRVVQGRGIGNVECLRAKLDPEALRNSKCLSEHEIGIL